MRFAQPASLFLIVLALLPWLLSRSRPRVAWPTLAGFGKSGRVGANVRAALPVVLRGMAVAMIVVALARPQTVGGTTRIAGEGVAIVVALDQSSSMNAADFPDGPGRPPIARLDAARRTIARFVEGRPDDLIGLVVFANYPDLACAPTLNHEFLNDAVRSVRTARPGDDGTNLGDAIVWSTGVLKNASPHKKVLILLTDGRNSPAVPRPTDPIQAATIARGLGITVHTVAVGEAGGRVDLVEPITRLNVANEVEGPDLTTLDAIAKAGGGRPFVATDADALGKDFATIDELEKSPVRGVVRTRYREEYRPFVAAALGLLIVDRLLSAGRLRRLP